MPLAATASSPSRFNKEEDEPVRPRRLAEEEEEEILAPLPPEEDEDEDEILRGAKTVGPVAKRTPPTRKSCVRES